MFWSVSLTVVRCLVQTAATPSPAPGSTSSHTCSKSNTGVKRAAEPVGFLILVKPSSASHQRSLTHSAIHMVLWWCDPCQPRYEFQLFQPHFFFKSCQAVNKASLLPAPCCVFISAASLFGLYSQTTNWEQRRIFRITAQCPARQTQRAPLILSLLKSMSWPLKSKPALVRGMRGQIVRRLSAMTLSAPLITDQEDHQWDFTQLITEKLHTHYFLQVEQHN